MAGLQGALGLPPAMPFPTHPITGTLQMENLGGLPEGGGDGEL